MKRMNRTMALAAFAVASLFLVSGMSGLAGDYVETDVDMIAGQHTDVGNVNVYDDGDTLYVTFTTTGDWVITETHVEIVDMVDTHFPLTKKNNPKVGHFTYSDEHDYETEVVWEIEDVWDGTIYVGAHAVVALLDVTEAPFYGTEIVDYWQGPKKDGNPVREARSDPENGLYYETGRDESNFFSLGFEGWIILEFDCPIPNGEGDDIRVIEDTWGGGYPLETADVYASQDGTNWFYLGEADNTDLDIIHTVSFFDLGDLEWAKYIKVVDTTNPAPHNNAADGYDLNAVEALHDCVKVVDMETAWGFTTENGIDFGGSSWAMYFEVVESN